MVKTRKLDLAEAQSAARQRRPTCFPLLDTPDVWLAMLAYWLDKESRLACFQACKSLRRIILEHSTSVSVKLQPLRFNPAIAISGVKLVQHSKNVAIISSCEARHMPPSMQATAKESMYQLHAAALNLILVYCENASLLGCVKLLHVQHASLGNPLALLRKSTLTTLRLEHCVVDWAVAATAGSFAVLSQLKTLELRHITWQNSSQLGPNLKRSILQQQMKSHSKLSSLVLHGEKSQSSGYNEFRCYAAGHHLTHLQFSFSDLDISSIIEFPSNISEFTGLQHLGMWQVAVDDFGMHQLLSMKQLTHIRVTKFELQGSFTHFSVPWKLLTMWDVLANQLAKLPLGNPELQLEVRVWPSLHKIDYPCIKLDKDLRVMDSALHILSKCKGIHWTMHHVKLGFEWSALDAEQQAAHLSRALQLTASASGYLFHNLKLSTPTMQMLCNHLQASPHVRWLRITNTCSWSPPGCAMLMHSMPVGSHFALGTASEATLTQICCMAQRPMRVGHGSLPPGYKKRISDAMWRCGHQHITLESMVA